MMNRVTVIGLGRIGLPIALILEKTGFPVIGIDINKSHLNAINTKSLYIEEPRINHLFKTSKIRVCTQPSISDIFLICVPTPLTQKKEADLSCLHSAMMIIQSVLQKGNLVIIESTCPIGTTNEIASHFPGVHFAYCPERIMPGKILKELTSCDRLIGGVDSKATKKAVKFYSFFCRGKLHKVAAKMAEAVKLAENAYRNVNIAFANELSMLATSIGLSDRELIALANCHPRVNILHPGPGVGGHCIPVDPEFLIQRFPKETMLLQASKIVNEKRTTWVEEEIKKAIERNCSQIIALFGLTYKANISDFRHSPALAIYQSLKKRYKVIPVDPFYAKGVDIQNAITKADLLVGLVAHDAFRKINKRFLQGKIIFDYAQVFP